MTATNTLTNLAAAVESARDIRDIRPPIAIPNYWLWLWLALGLLTIAAVAAVVLILWRKRQRQPILAPIIPPHERARRKLEAALELFDQPKPFCTVVSDAVRLYLEERFGLSAPERTTDEFLGDLTHSPVLTEDQKVSLESFLTSCDLVKFAKYEPHRQEMNDLYTSALKLIEETEPHPTTQPNDEPPAQQTMLRSETPPMANQKS